MDRIKEKGANSLLRGFNQVLVDTEELPFSVNPNINIFLKVRSTVPFKVRKTDRIKILKQYSVSTEGVSDNLLNLIHDGRYLDDDELTFEECNIQDNSKVTLVLDTMSVVARKLHIRIPSSPRPNMEITANVSDTIFLIKSMIVNKFQGDPYNYTLMLQGKELESFETLASLNINGPTTMYLIKNPQQHMRICVYTPSLKTISLEVRKLHTVGYVKAIIGSMICFNVEHGALRYAGEILDDSRTFASYDIIDNAAIHLVFTFEVFVMLWKGRTISITVLSSDDVNVINRKVYEQLQLPFCSHRIYFQGKMLLTGFGIGGYGVKRGSTLKLGHPVV